MGLATTALVLIAMAECLTTVTHAISGRASFYHPPYFPSTCFDRKDQNVMIVAANTGLFANKSACGRRYRVRCAGEAYPSVPRPCRGNNSIDIAVIELCRGCERDQLELSQQAFAMIADPNASIVRIDYQQI